MGGFDFHKINLLILKMQINYTKADKTLYFFFFFLHLSHHVGKPTICLRENKGADQLRSNCEADQRLCFCFSNSIVPLLLKSEISRF